MVFLRIDAIKNEKKREIDFISLKIDTAKNGNLSIFSTGERYPASRQARFTQQRKKPLFLLLNTIDETELPR